MPIPTQEAQPQTLNPTFSGAFLPCSLCALWRPAREDSLADDIGKCPRRLFPHAITHATDGCTQAVASKE